MQCSYFDAERCRSCTWMGQPYAAQVAGKEEHCRHLLGERPDLVWSSAVTSAEQGFRNKAKMVVTGSVEDPALGIVDADGVGVDLRDCGLYPEGLRSTFPVLAEFVTAAAIQPYDIVRRAGELKYLLVTQSPDGELMVRFVLRSQEAVARIRKHLPVLLGALPLLRVVSVNLQPEHKAVLEGEREIVLTAQDTLRMRLNGIDMHLRPQSFFQTNTEVAAALYRQARDWVDELAPSSVWDLYCGVGGFALHCADGSRDVTGIETSAEAVTSAETSRREADLTRLDFRVGDATAFAVGAGREPDLVIVNPPRRGIGPELSRWLEGSSVDRVIYSSCNATSLARDLAAMPSLRPRRARLLDMFPQTTHYEVVTLLERAA
ncbi:23S rRNA (uracil(747)-C(5))-methyltransferase RlmC [Cellulomonas chitinilytica]|uniref:23S rRNA (Uracil(747)-C(5))-methyltransferase RlmC n=1 Tax=Cellulomonas chitinilytica TaxID=398759 RepID=A0A919P2R7_9CELL|nr:23S rRNA (uracil(747)-C(5))-methyltransferase RlmC [Cellulomonas chitinilytica]GIG21062.1 23S rRNA (uracil(747)-C(5))-methyltransferase RlmC [Cellulomonas chitinilytica]